MLSEERKSENGKAAHGLKRDQKKKWNETEGGGSGKRA